MKNRLTHTLKCISFASVALLSGCAPFVQVKDMTSDKPTYLADLFTIDALPGSVQAMLPAPGTHPLPFKTLIIAGASLGHVGGANTIQADFRTTLINVKDTGVVQQIFDTTSNGVPSAFTYSLYYLNLFTLDQETAIYSHNVAALPSLVHEADNSQFVIDQPHEDATYTTTFMMGTPVQLLNFRTVVSTCHTGRYYPASQVSSALSGQAVDLDCAETKDGIVQTKVLRTYLTAYGIGVIRSMATATAKFDWTYSSFAKDGEPLQDKPL
jgi:hypothetical protein